MLNSLSLADFRNYEKKAFSFEKVTVFVGPNGIGKTNVLEAIGFLALARSFRARLDKEVIAWEKEVARIVGKTDEATIEIALTHQEKGGKLIKINGVNRRSIELLGHLMMVLFLPESLSLVSGPPQLRRQFLDLLLIQEDRRYAYHIVQLQKVLRQRNRLLRQIDEGEAEKSELTFWDTALAEHGSYLVAARVKALRALNQTLDTHYQIMSQAKASLQLRYKAASVSESGGEQEQFTDPKKAPTEREVWTKSIAASLERYQAREIAAGASLYGPQRDDFSFVLDSRTLSAFGSRGEFRSAILALKAAEADYLMASLEQRDETVPLVFLLDDVYSELDKDRRHQLATLIGDHQAVITTTELSYLDKAIESSAKIIELDAK